MNKRIVRVVFAKRGSRECAPDIHREGYDVVLGISDSEAGDLDAERKLCLPIIMVMLML